MGCTVEGLSSIHSDQDNVFLSLVIMAEGNRVWKVAALLAALSAGLLVLVAVTWTAHRGYKMSLGQEYFVPLQALEYEIPYDQSQNYVSSGPSAGSWAYESYNGPSDGSYTWQGIRWVCQLREGCCELHVSSPLVEC